MTEANKYGIQHMLDIMYKQVQLDDDQYVQQNLWSSIGYLNALKDMNRDMPEQIRNDMSALCTVYDEKDGGPAWGEADSFSSLEAIMYAAEHLYDYAFTITGGEWTYDNTDNAWFYDVYFVIGDGTGSNHHVHTFTVWMESHGLYGEW